MPQKAQQDAEAGQQNGEGLKTRRPFPQKDAAQQHVHQRIGVIAETRLKDLPRADRPDVQEPVQRHHAGTAEHDQGGPAIPQGVEDFPPAPGQPDHRSERDERKDDAVTQNLEGSHRIQHMPEQDQKAPGQKREHARQRPEKAVIGGRNGTRHGTLRPFAQTATLRKQDGCPVTTKTVANQRLNERANRSAMALRPLASRKRVPVAVKWVCSMTGSSTLVHASFAQRYQPSCS